MDTFMTTAANAGTCTCHEPDPAMDKLQRRITLYYTLAAVLIIVMMIYFFRKMLRNA